MADSRPSTTQVGWRGGSPLVRYNPVAFWCPVPCSQGWTNWVGVNPPTKRRASACIRGFSTATNGAVAEAIDLKTRAADSRAARRPGSWESH